MNFLYRYLYPLWRLLTWRYRRERTRYYRERRRQWVEDQKKYQEFLNEHFWGGADLKQRQLDEMEKRF